jgi:hypothetical protein
MPKISLIREIRSKKNEEVINILFSGFVAGGLCREG